MSITASEGSAFMEQEMQQEIKQSREDGDTGNAAAGDKKNPLTRKRIWIFLIMTFLITYVIEIFIIGPRVGSTDENEALLAQSMISGVMFAPTIGVILTRLITGEGFSLKSLNLTIRWKEKKKVYLLTWGGIALLILLGTIFYFLIFSNQFDPQLGYVSAVLTSLDGTAYTTAQLWQYMFFQILIGIVLSPLANILNCFGEEWGWRGYLLPKLLLRFQPVTAVVLDGLIWGIWHAPLVALVGLNYGTGYAGFPILGILAMCIFCVAVGTILSYASIQAKSCVPAILGHGLINGFASIGIYFSSLEHPYNVFLGPAPTGLIGGIFFLAAAAVLLRKLSHEEVIWEENPAFEPEKSDAARKTDADRKADTAAETPVKKSLSMRDRAMLQAEDAAVPETAMGDGNAPADQTDDASEA